jgi:hypothetical protein
MLVVPMLVSTESEIIEVRAAASSIGVSVEIFGASTNREIDAAFANIVRNNINAVVVPPEVLFSNRRVHIATLATSIASDTCSARNH